MADQAKSVVYIALPDGGICHYTYGLADAMQRAGTNANVLMLTQPSYDFESLPHQHQYRTTLPPGIGYVERLLKPLRSQQIVTQEARSADVVHVQHTMGPRTDAPVWAALRKHGKPIVYTAHDVIQNDPDEKNARQNLWIYNNADHLIVHGAALYENLLSLNPAFKDKCSIIPLGNMNMVADGFSKWNRESARASFKLTEEEKVILFFGFIRPYKGLDVLVDACRTLGEKDPATAKKIRLLVAGRAYDKDWPQIKQNIDSSFLAGQSILSIDYIATEDVGRYFHAADVVAMPYKRGSQSGVLQLAYAFAKPVVITNVGSFAEVTVNGDTGLLVPPDDRESFADALLAVLADADKAQQMGQRGRRYAETALSWDKIAQSTQAVYNKVLAP